MIVIANTHGAEILYSLIRDSMKLDNETVLLDICCGTGTIGITLANVNHRILHRNNVLYEMYFRM